MQFSAYSPQYAFGPSVAPMPMYKGGGDVKETYGLRNAAEQLRERGRGDDTILAHINPQEAGILKLLGGSGTINPYTGLPEFKSWNPFKSDNVYSSAAKEIGRVGSSIGKELERGVESLAKDPILGPITQMAVAYYGGPIGSAIYAGLAPEGSSFNTQNALRAGATTAAFNAMSAPDSNVLAPRGSITDVFGSGMQQVPMDGISGVAESAPSVLESIGGTMDAAGSANIPGDIGSLERAVASAGSQGIPYPPDPNSYVSGAPAINQSAVLDSPTMIDAYPGAPSAPAAPDMSGFEGGVTERGGSYKPDYNLPPVEDFSRPASPDFSGIRGLDPAGENLLGAAGSLAEGAYDLAVSNPKTALTAAYMGYTAYQTKKELDAAREEAERVLADIENRKQEEIEWARGVMRDYAPNYERLTAEEVARERGMASGGIASFDDERGSDDELMQGGIASLAKGGLPPRYLQGAGDGMSDSIHARIGGKQEARLADGEFVVPADVVSHLGNGSSNAGAKKLYAMMDRVRNARTGKKRQAPQVKTERYMPA
jgi:hypothetical protein